MGGPVNGGIEYICDGLRFALLRGSVPHCTLADLRTACDPSEGRTGTKRSHRSRKSSLINPGPSTMATGGIRPEIRVAVVDSGWDRALEEARVGNGVAIERTAEGAIAQSLDDQDRVGHGTACCDLVLQVAPSCTIIPIRVFDQSLRTDATVISSAIGIASAMACDVVNLSVGATTLSDGLELWTACERARTDGLILVAASGGQRHPFPAAFESVISVGSAPGLEGFAFTVGSLELAEFGCSPRGSTARGLGGKPCTMVGTSFAAPVIAGEVANLLGAHGRLPLDDVRILLEARAVSRFTPTLRARPPFTQESRD